MDNAVESIEGAFKNGSADLESVNVILKDFSNAFESVLAVLGQCWLSDSLFQ